MRKRRIPLSPEIPKALLQSALSKYSALQSNPLFQQRYFNDNQDVQWLKWYDIADPFIKQHPLSMVIAHPGSGKSTLISYIDPIRRICKDPSTRICYFGKTGRKSSKYMTNVGRELKFNEDLINDFGPFYKENDPDHPWNTEQIRVLGSKRSKKTPTLINFGKDSDIEGLRFDHVVIDDPGDINTARSAAQTRQLDFVIGSLIDRLDRNGTMIFTTRRFLINDIVDVILDERPYFKDMILPAIHAPDDIFTPDDNGIPMAEDIWPGDSLVKQKKDRHKKWEWLVWYQQMRLSPANAVFGGIPKRYEMVGPINPVIFSTADVAYSTDENNDFSVAMAGCAFNNGILLTDVQDWRINRGWASRFIEFARLAGASILKVEINNAQTLGVDCRDYVERKGYGLEVLDLNSRIDKGFRIGEFAEEADEGRVYFLERLVRNPAFKNLIHEWDLYPNVSHVDHLDCLEMLFTLITQKPQRAPPPSIGRSKSKW